MAVYTEISEQDLTTFLKQFNLGKLVQFQGVPTGVENTNYCLKTRQKLVEHTFYLTLFERHDAAETSYFVDLIRYLDSKCLPVAAPIVSLNQSALLELKGKPAVLTSAVTGTHPSTPNAAHCTAIGHFLAQMHLVSGDCPLNKPNPKSHLWWEHLGSMVANKLNPFDGALLLQEISYLKEHWPKSTTLPYGVIHGDLFTDNVFFDDNAQLCGVIDFYNASDDFFIYDLAIAANAWCTDEYHRLNPTLVNALTTSYIAVKPLNRLEFQLWPVMLRAAAVRFWLSRLIDWHWQLQHPNPGLTPKNPDEMRQLLTDRQRHQYVLQPLTPV